MTDAPEVTVHDRIWVDLEWQAYLRPTFDGDTSGYTRTDLIPAMLAEAEQRGREAEREAWVKAAMRLLPEAKYLDLMLESKRPPAQTEGP